MKPNKNGLLGKKNKLTQTNYKEESIEKFEMSLVEIPQEPPGYMMMMSV